MRTSQVSEGTVTMDAPVTFAETTNDLFVAPGAQLIVNGHPLSIGGDLKVTTSNVAVDGLIMTNANDEVIVGTNATFTTSSQHSSVQRG